MRILRTPDERFANLLDYPFKSNYIQHENIRIHYVDEGESNEEVVLLIHGEPSWSYLYRKMIPIIAESGYRVIVPDLVGFGMSDKPINQEDYTYEKHVEWITSFIENLDLMHITLFCQDWGGLIGLRIASEQEYRFKRIIASNTSLPTGDYRVPEAFVNWQNYSQSTPVFNVGKIIKSSCVNGISQEVQQAYDAPFPDEDYKAGARRFPMLVPTKPDDPSSEPNREAWEKLKHWEKPFLTAFSDSDPITTGGDRLFQKLIPGCKGMPHKTIVGAGHFLQEDKGPELGQMIVDFINNY
ncbi:MAG: haloalkane dehalogenase [Candidatus Neomarinimicrobiota bacterium]|nr:haloalkane dehalogenase [Candidatus Neomarinimicrobiota bacterium]